MSSSQAPQVIAAVKALADAVRWQIVEQLADGPRSASDLGEGFDISAPAVSRHLKVLLEGGVVEVEAQGRQRMYSLRPQALRELSMSLQEMAGEGPIDLQAAPEAYRAGAATDWQVW